MAETSQQGGNPETRTVGGHEYAVGVEGDRVVASRLEVEKSFEQNEQQEALNPLEAISQYTVEINRARKQVETNGGVTYKDQMEERANRG